MRSRFHGANPAVEITTTCGPVVRPSTDGVLPTYLPSTVTSAPAGVEVKLHFTVCGKVLDSTTSARPPVCAAGGTVLPVAAGAAFPDAACAASLVPGTPLPDAAVAGAEDVWAAAATPPFSATGAYNWLLSLP